MKKEILCILIAFSSLTCKKDIGIPEKNNDPPVNTIIPATDYQPLTIGSYWVYDVYSVDSGRADIFIRSDTTRITRDTIIRGLKYSEIKGFYISNDFSNFVRDSSSYLVNDNGLILFSTNKNSDTLFVDYSTSGYAEYLKMLERDTSIKVPAGTYKTIDAIYYYWPTKEYLRDCHRFFTLGVGEVKSVCSYGYSSYQYERRLVSYYLKK